MPKASPAHRRNGKAASCEPCRKAKIACDHERPVCKRCQHRGLNSSCFYHPAPLTKVRRPNVGTPTDVHAPLNSGLITATTLPTPQSSVTDPARSEEITADTVVFQGLSDLSAALRRHDAQSHSANKDTISAIAECLRHLQHLERMIEVLELFSVSLVMHLQLQYSFNNTLRRNTAKRPQFQDSWC
jgi:hypothetical protein